MAEKKTVTAMNNEVREGFFTTIMATMLENGIEPIQTDVTAFDVALNREDGKTVYATVKVTVHKDDYSVEDKAAEFSDVMAQREKRAAELAAKKAKEAEAKAKREAEKAAKNEKAKATLAADPLVGDKARGMALSPAYD